MRKDSGHPFHGEQEGERPERDERQPEANEDEVRRRAGQHRVERIEERPAGEEERRGRQASLQPRCESRPDHGDESDGQPGNPRTEGDDTGSVERGRHLGSRDRPVKHFPPEKALYWAVATPQMPPTFDAPRIVSLGSGIAWLAVGLIPVVRTRLASRLERGLAATAFFLAGWAFLDALYPVLSGTSPDLVFIGFRLTFITFGTLALLLTVKWVARVLSHRPRGPDPGGDSSAVQRRLEPGLPGGVRDSGARHRDLHVLPHRGAPRGPRLEPEPPDRGRATRRPSGRRRELRRNERPPVRRLCRHRNALRGSGDRRGPRGIRHCRGGLRWAGSRRPPGRADPSPENVRGTEPAATRHLGRRDLDHRRGRERIVELLGASGTHGPAPVAEGLAGRQAPESLVTGQPFSPLDRFGVPWSGRMSHRVGAGSRSSDIHGWSASATTWRSPEPPRRIRTGRSSRQGMHTARRSTSSARWRRPSPRPAPSSKM